MATKTKKAGPKFSVGRKKRAAPVLDELGGAGDGSLAILDGEGNRIHGTPAAVATSLRYLLARVHMQDVGGLPNRVAMTSALKGEGVTYVSRSLAAVIAYDTDRSVVVVDTNWRRPDPMAAEQPPPGLADAVEHGAPIDDIIVATSNPRLSLVPPGVLPVARRPAIASGDAIASVIDKLASRFDHVLLDLPPVLASADAINLAQLADAFLLVVRQGATASAQVEAALEELRGMEPLGVVLNRFDSKIPRRIRRLVGT
jgi:Mrp family chromosome partitioning ATPase